MKKYKIIIYLILLFSASCKSQNNNTAKIKEDTSQAKILNNLALKISELSCNKDSIEKSIRLIEEAIKLDSTVPLYYRNEAQMYCLLKKYQDAIKVLNRYLLYNINSPLETLKGFIFEKTENMDSAMTSYTEVMKQYNLKIQKDPKNASLLLNRAFLLFFTQGDKEAKMEYTKIESKFPNDEQVKGMRDNFYSFERKSYITQLFSPCN